MPNASQLAEFVPKGKSPLVSNVVIISIFKELPVKLVVRIVKLACQLLTVVSVLMSISLLKKGLVRSLANILALPVLLQIQRSAYPVMLDTFLIRQHQNVMKF